MIKLYVNDDQTGTLVCPECRKTRIIDVSRYLDADRLKIKCPCGHAFSVLLEKRRKFRKETRLPGIYRHSSVSALSKNKEYTGGMTVIDISLSGMRLKLDAQPRFTVGEIISLEFKLDDANRSQIRKNVVVRSIKGLLAGVEYTSAHTPDSALGFYLFN